MDEKPEETVEIPAGRWLLLEGIAHYFGQWVDSLPVSLLDATIPGDRGQLLLTNNRLEGLRSDTMKNGDTIMGIHAELQRRNTHAIFETKTSETPEPTSESSA
jgi:hypothetical protein